MRRRAEGRAVHHGDALGLQQLGREVLVRSILNERNAALFQEITRFVSGIGITLGATLLSHLYLSPCNRDRERVSRYGVRDILETQV